MKGFGKAALGGGIRRVTHMSFFDDLKLAPARLAAILEAVAAEYDVPTSGGVASNMA